MTEINTVKHQLLLSDWAKKIAACQSSALTVNEWCQRQNINSKTYYYWLKRVREYSLQQITSNLTSNVPVTKSISDPVPVEEKVTFKKLEVESPIANMQPAVIIRLPNATLEISNNATQHTVEAVLLALKTIC